MFYRHLPLATDKNLLLSAENIFERFEISAKLRGGILSLFYIKSAFFTFFLSFSLFLSQIVVYLPKKIKMCQTYTCAWNRFLIFCNAGMAVERRKKLVCLIQSAFVT